MPTENNDSVTGYVADFAASPYPLILLGLGLPLSTFTDGLSEYLGAALTLAGTISLFADWYLNGI